MTARHAFLRGVVGGCLLLLSLEAAHWLASSAAVAGVARKAAVVLQLVGGLAGLVAIARTIPAGRTRPRRSRLTAPAPDLDHPGRRDPVGHHIDRNAKDM